MCAVGVNRISLGVQSTISHVLTSLDRTHDVENVQHAVECIRSVGISTFNLDLIYGTAGETVDEWRSCLTELLRHDPPHISAYALTVEPGTRSPTSATGTLTTTTRLTNMLWQMRCSHLLASATMRFRIGLHPGMNVDTTFCTGAKVTTEASVVPLILMRTVGAGGM